MRTPASRLAFVILNLAACAALAQTAYPTFLVTGRLAVSEPHGCDSGTWPDYGITNATLTWTECHAVKQHMDSRGNPVTTNAFDPDALRPLQMTVDVDVRCYYPKLNASDANPIASARTQTDASGLFKVEVPRAPCGMPKEPVGGLVVIVSALMLYEATDTRGNPVGLIRGLWERTAGSTVYSSVLGPEPTTYNDGTNEYIIPRFVISYATHPVHPGVIDLGAQVFFSGASPSYFGWLRGALSQWQTEVNLHDRLKAALAVDGHDPMYARMFDPAQPACPTACYWWFFGPQPDNFWTYLGLVSIGYPAHEFGHLMHFFLAPESVAAYDPAWVMAQSSAGAITYARQSMGAYGSRQTQDMGFALMEGFADAMGSYFLNGCRVTPDQRWESPDPRLAWLNPGNWSWCEPYGDCPYGNFRFQMLERGIAERSTEWNDRVDLLAYLADDARSAGATMVSSNSEYKVRNFICDVLDDDEDVSYATGHIGGVTYVRDYGWHAAERVDGRKHPPTFATYAADPPRESVRLTLGQLLDAMSAFAGPAPFPSNLPSPIVDGANRAYNDARMSVDSRVSMQSLAAFMVTSGVVTRAEANGILSGNRMEEIP